MFFSQFSAVVALVAVGQVVGHSPRKPAATHGASVSFVQTHVCETTPHVKAFSGYVHLPGNSTGRAYDINTFFIFFEARKDPKHAPLTIWLQGGPGSPSTPAAIGENGPCKVLRDSKTTELNPWSWNNVANLLYIDQPVQTGFSYDTLIKGAINEVVSPFLVLPQDTPLNDITLAGTFASQNPLSTASTASVAAVAAWEFIQAWMKKFPQYRPKDNKLSLWGESYGGHYVPTFSSYFVEQSKSVSSGDIPLKIDTVGIVNGCVDILTQMPFYPLMANNNTYGLRLYSDDAYTAAVGSFPKCQALVNECQSAAYRLDPWGQGTNVEVNKKCKTAFQFCYSSMAGPYGASGHNVFDIAALNVSSFPPKYAAGYLNTKEVQDALGTPLNFTGYAASVDQAFGGTGDFALGRNLAILGQLLDAGTKVSLVYGDLDFQCNWLGGEAISKAITSTLSPAFAQAGYADLQVNGTYVGGKVRQAGNLSFIRVFEAGHEVPYFQPEAAFEIFRRVSAGLDVATGTAPAGEGYQTHGPQSVQDVTHAPPAQPPVECYFWDMFQTCTAEQMGIIAQGKATFNNFILVGAGAKSTSHV